MARTTFGKLFNSPLLKGLQKTFQKFLKSSCFYCLKTNCIAGINAHNLWKVIELNLLKGLRKTFQKFLNRWFVLNPVTIPYNWQWRAQLLESYSTHLYYKVSKKLSKSF